MEPRLKIATFPGDFRYYERDLPPYIDEIIRELTEGTCLKLPRHHWILKHAGGTISVISSEYTPESAEPIYEMWDKEETHPRTRMTANNINEHLARRKIPAPAAPAPELETRWPWFSVN